MAALTWLGTVLGTVGLVLTFREARKARQKAEAVDLVTRQLAERLALPDLGYVSGQIAAMQMVADLGGYEQARHLLTQLTRIVVHILTYFQGIGGLTSEIEQARRAMNEINTELDRLIGSGDEPDPRKLQLAMRSLKEFVDTREGELRFTPASRSPP